MTAISHPTTTDKDLGYKRILEQYAEAKGSHVVIGYFGDKGDEKPYEGPQTISEVAFYNEFGTKHIPERPFMRGTMDRKSQTYLNFQRELIDKVLGGAKTVKGILIEYGEKVRGDIVGTIKAFRSPPNAPPTIAKKSRTIRGKGKRESFAARGGNPLIDTGHMMGATSYEVRMGGSK